MSIKNKNGLPNQYTNEPNGMTLAEVIIGMFMLAAFTGIFLIVTDFTNRFFISDKSELEGSQGLLIDHHKINMSMDKTVEILSQPGYSLGEILEISKNCSYYIPPKRIWGLPANEDQELPDGYKYCLVPTSLSESNIEDLASNTANSKPGIYILYASPLSDKISINALPLRRIFCRPKPYC